MIQAENSDGLTVEAQSGANRSGTNLNIDAQLTQVNSRPVLGHIYFLQAGGFIKIGFARVAGSRLMHLQTGCPVELVPLGGFPGTLRDEQNTHAMFADLHVRGEWFRNHSRILEYLDARDPDNAPRIINRPKSPIEGRIRERIKEGIKNLNLKPPVENYELGYDMGYLDALRHVIDDLNRDPEV